jgi:hypothetical protein
MSDGEFSFYYRIRVAVDVWFSLFIASMKKTSGIELIHAKLKNTN